MAGGSNNRYPSRRLRGIMVNGIFMERHFSNWMFYRNPHTVPLAIFASLCLLVSLSLYVYTRFFFHVNFRTTSLFAPSFFICYLGSSTYRFFARPLKAIHTLFSSPRPSLFHYPEESSTDSVCTQPNAAWHEDTLNHVLTRLVVISDQTMWQREEKEREIECRSRFLSVELETKSPLRREERILGENKSGPGSIRSLSRHPRRSSRFSDFAKVIPDPRRKKNSEREMEGNLLWLRAYKGYLLTDNFSWFWGCVIMLDVLHNIHKEREFSFDETFRNVWNSYVRFLETVHVDIDRLDLRTSLTTDPYTEIRIDSQLDHVGGIKGETWRGEGDERRMDG